MLKQVFLFEVKYRSTRPATYIFFFVAYLLSFLLVASPALEVPALISPNAPYLLTILIIVISFCCAVFNSAIVGVPIVRDVEHQMEPLLFTKPLKKSDYLLGRFCGSVLISLFIHLAAILGVMSAYMIGNQVPWEVSWAGRSTLPFDVWHYAYPFLVFAVPNVFITSAIFFASGTLGRRSVVVYSQGVIFIVVYQLFSGILQNLESRTLAALIDPLGLQAFAYHTQHWSVAEQNTLMVNAGGLLGLNRLLWVFVGVISMVITCKYFSFRSLSGKSQLFAPRGQKPTEANQVLSIPSASVGSDSTLPLKQIWKHSWLNFHLIKKEITFLSIVFSGLLFLLIQVFAQDSVYGVDHYPTSYRILELLDSFSLFLILLAVIYPGELVWKERQLQMKEIIDAMPIHDFVDLLSKVLSLAFIYMGLLTVLMVFGIALQSYYSFYDFELTTYLGVLFGQTFTNLLLITIISFVIHVIINHKFLGYFISVLFLLVNGYITNLGIESSLFQFASGSLVKFSDMNRFGHFIEPFVWLRVYWMAFAGMLLTCALAFVIRGYGISTSDRIKIFRERFSGGVVITITVFALIFLFSGSGIFYNSHIVNTFQNSADSQIKKQKYKSLFESFAQDEQPEIVETYLTIDLVPADRSFVAEGYYYLKNKTFEPIKSIHVSQHWASDLTTNYTRFDRAFVASNTIDPALRYEIFTLEKPLMPNDSLKMSFRVAYSSKGFKVQNVNNDVVFNGTYLGNDYFPKIGYRADVAMAGEGEPGNFAKKEAGNRRSSEKPMLRPPKRYGSDPGMSRVELIVSTEKDQTVIGPGKLVKTWEADERRFFHFKTDQSIPNDFAVSSARYSKATDQWGDISLEIYHHPSHGYNIERMMVAMRDALKYQSEHFGSYPYDELRIVEFPRYEDERPVFSGTIPVSESHGFTLKSDDTPEGFDLCYFLTAKAVAQQWWGQQVVPANKQGKSLLTHGLAQYSALMIAKKVFHEEAIKSFLASEMEQYLSGRSKSQQVETPLISVEDQQHIYGSKASLAFFLLQDLAGEANINRALASFNNEWKDQSGGNLPTSADLVEHLRSELPDSLHYLVRDLFEEITLFSNKTDNATYTQLEDGRYEVEISFTCQKYHVSRDDTEEPVPLADWVEVGIFYMTSDEELELTRLERVKITDTKNTATFIVDHLPAKAGIDPLNKLIDKNFKDNTIGVRQKGAANSPFF